MQQPDEKYNSYVYSQEIVVPNNGANSATIEVINKYFVATQLVIAAYEADGKIIFPYQQNINTDPILVKIIPSTAMELMNEPMDIAAAGQAFKAIRWDLKPSSRLNVEVSHKPIATAQITNDIRVRIALIGYNRMDS